MCAVKKYYQLAQGYKTANFVRDIKRSIWAFVTVNDLEEALQWAELFNELSGDDTENHQLARKLRAFVKNLLGDPQEPQPLVLLFNLKRTAKKVDQEIVEGTWKITMEEL